LEARFSSISPETQELFPTSALFMRVMA